MTSVEKTLPVLLGQRRRGKNDRVPQGAKGHCGYITFTYVVLTFTSRRCKIRDRVAGPLARSAVIHRIPPSPHPILGVGLQVVLVARRAVSNPRSRVEQRTFLFSHSLGFGISDVDERR